MKGPCNCSSDGSDGMCMPDSLPINMYCARGNSSADADSPRSPAGDPRPTTANDAPIAWALRDRAGRIVDVSLEPSHPDSFPAGYSEVPMIVAPRAGEGATPRPTRDDSEWIAKQIAKDVTLEVADAMIGLCDALEACYDSQGPEMMGCTIVYGAYLDVLQALRSSEDRAAALTERVRTLENGVLTLLSTYDPQRIGRASSGIYHDMYILLLEGAAASSSADTARPSSRPHPRATSKPRRRRTLETIDD